MYNKNNNFTALIVWQKAHNFVLGVYKITSKFPKEEIYILTSQFRKAAISIPANIAEGYKKSGKKDKIQFYDIAQGSLEECRYYIILSNDLEYGKFEELYQKLEEVSKLLSKYSSTIKNSEF
ncbi:hypothetical protein BMS3Abin04_02911 [bacterium BMS3Abin04]|nr:hypothetical protein BMS3Abin04_02911 [bacterium BMS3Abin04]